MDDPFRILLIDDSSDDRVLIRRALTQEFAALEVAEVDDAEALERALNAQPFDLVITDYNLGFTDGFTLLDALKARWPDWPCSCDTCRSRGQREQHDKRATERHADWYSARVRHFTSN